jgi:hypothetical protein
VYKGGKVPRRRKKETPASLYKEVLAGLPETDGTPILTETAASLTPSDIISRHRSEPVAAAEQPRPAPNVASPKNAVEEPDAVTPKIEAVVPEIEAVVPEIEEGPVHRPLIRAQLPRIEGHKEERRLPEFTIRQAGRGGSNGHFRGADSRSARPGGHGANGGNPGGGGNRPHGGSRFAGSRPATPGRGQAGRGPAPGFRGQGQPRPGGPKKRPR